VAASGAQGCTVFFNLLLELGDFGAGLLELALGLLELLLESLDLLLGRQGTLLPPLTANREITTTNLSFLEFVFASSGLGLPGVPAVDEFGDENAWRAAERRERGLRRCRTVHGGCS
jgi:hypothetical protein